jgi:hypothetical protein
VENEKNFEKNGIFSKRVRAGKRRTYFFDVRETKGSDYYITITESKKRFNEENYDRHKIFIYKEDFIKFVNAMQETIDYIKAELLPDYDFNAHNHDNEDDDREYRSNNYRQQDKDEEQSESKTDEPAIEKTDEPEEEQKTPPPSTIVPPTIDDVDKWD